MCVKTFTYCEGNFPDEDSEGGSEKDCIFEWERFFGWQASGFAKNSTGLQRFDSKRVAAVAGAS